MTGAGATFPYPLYSKMFDVYAQGYGVKVNYQAIGSGGGIRQLINKTVDFGGSDAIMTEEDSKSAGAPVLHVPTCAGAVVVTYNLPNNPVVKLTPVNRRARQAPMPPPMAMPRITRAQAPRPDGS